MCIDYSGVVRGKYWMCWGVEIWEGKGSLKECFNLRFFVIRIIIRLVGRWFLSDK